MLLSTVVFRKLYSVKENGVVLELPPTGEMIAIMKNVSCTVSIYFTSVLSGRDGLELLLCTSEDMNEIKFWKHRVNASAKGLTQSYLQAVLQSRRQWNSRKSRPWWPVCHVSNIHTHTERTWSPNVSKITQVSSLILSNVQEEEWSVFGKLLPEMLFFLFVLQLNCHTTSGSCCHLPHWWMNVQGHFLNRHKSLVRR